MARNTAGFFRINNLFKLRAVKIPFCSSTMKLLKIKIFLIADSRTRCINESGHFCNRKIVYAPKITFLPYLGKCFYRRVYRRNNNLM